METNEPKTLPKPTLAQLLRTRWDVRLRGLPRAPDQENIRLRIHRSLSWLDRAAEVRACEGASAADDELIFTWTALNSLYGYWLPERNEPAPDIQSLEDFIDQVFDIDREELLVAFTNQHRDQILEVFDNQFLARQFWNAPSLQAADRRTSLGNQARSWFVEGLHKLILEKLLRNVYYLRCQLVHGAATRGSTLNRDTLGQCLAAIRPLAPRMIQVVIDHGLDADWGPACYPPIK